jgi:glycosyltransferase involved in cell wall biosynthesis
VTVIAVCVVTLTRPRYLERLLGALAGVDASGAEVVVVVVDNDPDASARAVVERWRGRLPWPIRYEVERERGIPAARNRAVALAGDADFLAFVDDDEAPSPQWLRELLAMQRRTGADAVMGRVEVEFEEEPPAWARDGGFFRRRSFLDGQEMAFGTTSNALVARRVFPAGREPFDRSMTYSGGSDLRFFHEARLAGHRIVWSDRAVVTEVFPASRVSLRWLVMRQYRRGTNRSGDLVHLHRSARRRVARVGRALLELASGSAALAASPVRGRVAAVRGCLRIAYGAGLLAGLFGARYDEYRVVHGR